MSHAWQPDVQAADEGGQDVEDAGAEDGVYLFKPHSSYVSGLRCAPAAAAAHFQPLHPACLDAEEKKVKKV